jgi:serine phosphatase RsbU (regulator of sigma subunit)
MKRLFLSKKYILFIILFWGGLHSASLFWNMTVVEKHAIAMGAEQGRITFQFLEIIRQWNTWTGGVFAKVSEHIQPNSFLAPEQKYENHPEYQNLTRITGPHMLRQISRLAHEKSGITFHLSSSEPINPANQSDKWESWALEKLNNGAEKVVNLTGDGKSAMFKYMGPLVVDSKCLECHKEAQIGDVRGGISIQVPAGKIFSSLAAQRNMLWFMHLISFSLLSSLTVFFVGKVRKQWSLIVEAKRMQDVLVERRTAELRHSNQKLQHERELVETVINRIRSHPSFDPRGLQILATPVEKTNGDIILAASRPDGVHHLLVGDFTGHGLPAAVCGPLVSGIFYMLTQQGSDPENLLKEINNHLCDQLPVNLFLAVSFIERNLQMQQVRVWNAGLPDVLVFRSGELKERVKSSSLFLGILKDLELESTRISCNAKDESRFFTLTDGIIETASSDDELFGMERVEYFIEQSLANNNHIDLLHDILFKFREEKEQEDDITLVEARMSD